MSAIFTAAKQNETKSGPWLQEKQLEREGPSLSKVPASRIKQKTPSEPMRRLNSASEEKHASPGDSFSSKLTDSGEGSDSEDDDGIMALAGWASNKSNQNSMLKRNIGKDVPQPALHRKNFYQNLDVETDAIVNA